MTHEAGCDAVVLLSGGLDSTTALAWARKTQGWRCATIAFDYGQRHRVELNAARRVAEALGSVAHRVVAVDLAAIGGSALTERAREVPKGGYSGGIPPTYVPARNVVFLSLAAGLAETLGCRRLVIGANVVDYSGYPDCRPEFLDAFAEALARGTKAGVEAGAWEIHAPLLRLSKREIVRLGLELGVDYGLTHSCYDPDDEGRACGWCDACRFRAEAFAELGVGDPALAHFADPESWPPAKGGAKGELPAALHSLPAPSEDAPPDRCWVCGGEAFALAGYLGIYPFSDPGRVIEQDEHGRSWWILPENQRRALGGDRMLVLGYVGCIVDSERMRRCARWVCTRCLAGYRPSKTDGVFGKKPNHSPS